MEPASDLRGLSHVEAAAKLAIDGPNALPDDTRRLPAILYGAIKEPMFLLLMAAAGLYLALGDLHESLLLLCMVGVTVGLTLYQEGKSEHALAALRDLSSPRALVIRDGERVRIPGRDVVSGDVLVLSEGDRIPADAVLVSANNLEVDESLLTGESWSVKKRVLAEEDASDADKAGVLPGGENSPFVWSGTLVVQGEGLARVTATGTRSEIGKIGSTLRNQVVERSPLQLETARLVRILAVGGIAFSLFVAGVYGALHGNWLQATLVGIALTMSLLPEEYPVILAVFPAIGAWRMSRAQVLTRRLAAIETLGAVSVLCTDKTGTLTENRMKVVRLYSPGTGLCSEEKIGSTVQPNLEELAQFSSLASRPHAIDPMERAFHQLAGRFETGKDAGAGYRLVREYALSPAMRAMSQVWAIEGKEGYLVAAKGAPEAVALLCRLSESDRGALKVHVDAMANEGLRVLAVARACCDDTRLPEMQSEFDFRFLGLLGLADPMRAEIPEAMRQCTEAGIRVLMITGDYPGTAASIARQAGLGGGGVLSGDEMESLDEPTLRSRLREASVCARITPAQKLRIVDALKANGEIVAMTGDGVNDAPALKAAHVGIAMGGRGTDVAREAASIVLLDDNFASIVRGIRLGRRIFVNMQNAMSYVMSMHVPIAGAAILPLLFGWPILLFPAHIAFLELIIDPTCSVAFENEASESDSMRRPPRDPKAPLFDKAMFLRAFLQGGVAMLLVAAAYYWSLGTYSEEKARAITFSVLISANLGLIFSNLSRRQSAVHVLMSKNRLPLIIAAIALGILALTIYFPPLAAAFRFGSPTLSEFGLALGWGATSMIWYELTKAGTRRFA